MTRETFRKLRDSGVLEAWAEGKTIQFQCVTGNWLSCPNITDSDEFDDRLKYRVAPAAITITREQFAEAWDSIVPRLGTMLNESATSAAFPALCKALGL